MTLCEAAKYTYSESKSKSRKEEAERTDSLYERSCNLASQTEEQQEAVRRSWLARASDKEALRIASGGVEVAQPKAKARFGSSGFLPARSQSQGSEKAAEDPKTPLQVHREQIAGEH